MPVVRTFGSALGDNEASLNRLNQADLVSEDGATFGVTSEGKNHRVDLVGVRINTRLPLRYRVALPVVQPADAYKIFSEYTQVEGVETHV